jgi:S1-C subfamily serine protease
VKKIGFLILLAVPGGLSAKPQDSCVQVIAKEFFYDPATGKHSATEGWGSGTVVSSRDGESLVLTNKHVAPHAGVQCTVWVGESTIYHAEFVAADGPSDLALLRVKAALPVMPVAAQGPAKGTALRHWGSIDQYASRLREGTVTETEGRFWTSWERAVEARINSGPGDSGAALVGPAGELVGVVGGASTHDSSDTLAIAVSEVTRFLADPEGESKKPALKKDAKNLPMTREYPPPPSMPTAAPGTPAYVPGFTGSGSQYTPAPRYYSPARSYGPGGYFPGSYTVPSK